MTYLHLFQIGPVQSFIAAARRTQDLYEGSQMLSTLASAGVRAAHDAGAAILFPAVDSDGNPLGGAPHRFAFVSDAEPRQIGANVEDAIQKSWLAVAQEVHDWLWNVIGGGDWETVFTRQVEAWLEIYWVAVDYTEALHGNCYANAARALAARKSLRDFPQVEEDGDKCTLTGAQSALPINWDALRKADPLDNYWSSEENDHIIIRSNEKLGSVALIKRMFPFVQGRKPQFPATDEIAKRSGRAEPPLYLAVLHMDGDRMGLRLSGMTSFKQHQAFSRKLSEFAAIAKKIVAHHAGELVYAGGDDVLALLPLNTTLACADELQKALTAAMGDGATASAGIAITAAGLPFDSALDDAREAEEIAKDEIGRNALVVRDSRSTAIREMGAYWDSGIVEMVEALQLAFGTGGSWGKGRLSGKLGYDLLELAYALDNPVTIPPEARKKELKRLIKRHVEPKTPIDQIDNYANGLSQIGEAHGWETLANWVILARFLAHGGRI